jgi:hypothetical protein
METMWNLYFYYRVVSTLGLAPLQGMFNRDRYRARARRRPSLLVLVVVLDWRSRLFIRMAGGHIWPNIRRRNEDEGDDDEDEDGGKGRRARARARLGARCGDDANIHSNR